MKRQHLFALAPGIALTLVLVWCTGLAQAQGPKPSGNRAPQALVGTSFTYQGRLTRSGSPANGTFDFRFILYNQLNGGAQVGSTVLKDDVTVTNGLFIVLLDFGSVFDGTLLFLEVSVREGSSTGGYTTLSPRHALWAKPYAIYATTAPWSGLTGVPGIWYLAGNSDTTAGTNFLGTTDNQALEFKVNSTRALRLEPNGTSPNLIGGYSGNSVTSGVVGATISGGGASGNTNRVTDYHGTVGGGSNNQAGNNNANLMDAFYATVGGGYSNDASGTSATVGGGYSNDASGSYATVGGGYFNTSGYYATVGGGSYNMASNEGSFVGGGGYNTADGFRATIGGGYMNTASGTRATVPGGSENAAAGGFSFAAGRRAKANNDGCFVWGDSTYADLNCNTNNAFMARANGGFWFGAATYSVTPTIGAGNFISTTTGAYLTTGGAWTNASDRNAKMNFAAVNGRDILLRLAEVPIQMWSYKAEDPSVRHIGATAQDFHAAFGVGYNNTSISTIDADGVALAAIQGLYQVVQEKDAEIASLRSQIAGLKSQVTSQQAEIDDLKARVAAIERASGQANGGESPPLIPAAVLVCALAGCVVLRRSREGGAG